MIDPNLFKTGGSAEQSPISGLVYGPLLNDQDSIEWLGDKLLTAPYKALPKAPILYTKPYNTHVGHGAIVYLPSGVAELEVGSTLGLVFGERASQVSEERALEAVAGYTVVIDLSAPHQSLFRPPIKEKCFDRACPIGPRLVNKAELPDPDSVIITTFINDEVQHQRNLANLVRPIPRLIADVTEFLTLYPGDVLMVGVPVNMPFARAGDRVGVEISGIGRLECLIDSTS